MLVPNFGIVLATVVVLAESRSLLEIPHYHNRFIHRRQNNDLELAADAVQTGSFKDGSVGGVITPGQSASKTSRNNFINFCEGKTLTNGLQVIGGSCSGIRESTMRVLLGMILTYL